jgi:hypothetical protein
MDYKANESGVDESVTSKFPGSEVTYGSAASGAGDNRDIPESEGGGLNPKTGQYVIPDLISFKLDSVLAARC